MFQNIALTQIDVFLQGGISLEDLQLWVAERVVEQDLPSEAAAVLDRLDVLLMELVDGFVSESDFRLEMEALISIGQRVTSSSDRSQPLDLIAALTNSSLDHLLPFTESTREEELAPLTVAFGT